MFEMGRRLSKMFQEDKMDGGDFLLKFLLDIRKISSMSPRVVWKLLYLGAPPPFSCWIPGEVRSKGQDGTGRKRQLENVRQMERKRTKP